MRNVPKLRFKEFSGEWEEIKLKEILEFKNGINASKEQYGKGIKFINVLDILNNDFIIYDNIIGKVDIDEKTLEKYSVNYGDILFQRSSETREEVGMANVYLDDKIATFGGFVIRGKKIANYVPTFINKVLKTDLARNEITSKSGGSTRYNVGQDILNEVQIIIPKLEEQEKIGNFLSSVDKKISIVEEKLNLFKEYKKGIMQKIFKQELRFKDENGNNYPQWEEKRLGEVSDIIMGQSPSSSEYNEEFKGLPLIQGNADCKNRKIYPRMYTTEITKESFPNDIIMTVRAPVGAISFSDIHSCIGRGVCAIRNANKFIYHYLIKLEDSWDKLAQGSTFTAVNSNDIKNLVIKLPCLEEQQKIADFLSAIDDKIENISDNLKNLKEFKKGLLQQMFV